MATISEGTRVAFTGANGEAKVGTVIEYTGANDGTGSWEYRVECGRFIYGVSEDDIAVLDEIDAEEDEEEPDEDEEDDADEE